MPVSVRQILREGSSTGFSDEHAVAKVWNAASGLPNKERDKVMKSPKTLQDWIAKAKTDENHPLHISHHFGTEGFRKGDMSNLDGYHKELHDAAYMVHALTNHDSALEGKKSLKQAFAERAPAKVTGASKPVISDDWKSKGGSDATSKADLVISDRDMGGEHHHTISLKKGDSQLMSAQSGEFRTTMHAAIDNYTKDAKVRKNLKDRVENFAQLQKTHRNAKNDAERDQLVAQKQKIINDIHKEHPELLQHVAYEAATGHGKFGHGAEGTAQYLCTFDDKGYGHVHNTETSTEPIAVSTIRAAKGKGTNSDGTFREGTARMDYKIVRDKSKVNDPLNTRPPRTNNKIAKVK